MSHARLYIAQNLADAALPEAVRQPGVDVEHTICDTLSISDARALQQRAYLRPVVGEYRQFLIVFSHATREAQNALLKLLEEPPVTAVFHLVCSRADVLLPTVRSRLLLMVQAESTIDRSVMREFLHSSLGERINTIATKAKAKDADWIEAILSGAEAYAHLQTGITRERLLRVVVGARISLGAPGASVKMIIEDLALTLPVLR